MIPIVPAIIPSSLDNLKDSLQKISFVNEVQVDVVDGQFVSFISWPYKPKGVPVEIKSETDKFTLEVDLMVNDPFEAAKNWIEAGADMLVFHVENLDFKRFQEFTLNTSVTVGISALNKTNLEKVLPFVEISDYMQLMGIAEIGAQGLPFDETVLDRIKFIKNKFPKKMVSIDGSVNKDTVGVLKEAGADRLVSGSAILKSVNPTESYRELLQLTNN